MDHLYMNMKKNYKMSYFKAPITNKRPETESVSLFDVYQLIRGQRFVHQTQELRTISDAGKRRDYKGGHFDYITPSGVFSYCKDNALIEHSSLLCIDLDSLGESLDKVKKKLLNDPIFETLLMFRSPSGDGLKWFTEIDLNRCDHRTWFAAVRNYLMSTYELTDKQVDKSCSNPSKACFLCFDPDVYIKKDLIENNKIKEK